MKVGGEFWGREKEFGLIRIIDIISGWLWIKYIMYIYEIKE